MVPVGFDKNAYVGFYALGVALAFLFNVVVIVGTVIVIVKHPTLQASSLPKFLAILLCSLAQLTIASLVESPNLHYLRPGEWDMPCTACLASYLSFGILTSFSMLTVAVAILSDVMRLLKMSHTRRMVITVSLLLLAAVYSLITFLSVNYLKTLRHPEDPCGEYGNFTVNEFGYWNRINMVVVYVPPAVVIIISLLLLVIVSINIRRTSSTEKLVSVSSERGLLTSRSSGRSVVGLNHSSATTATTAWKFTSSNVVQAPTGVHNHVPDETIHGFDTDVLRSTRIAGNNAVSVASVSQQIPLAADLLLAGIVTIILNFPLFYYHVFWYDPNKIFLDPQYTTRTFKLALGASFLSMCWLVLVPCCWLLWTKIIIKREHADLVPRIHHDMTSADCS